MLRTLNRTSNELVDAIRRTYAQNFIAGGAVYGWYDVFIELDISSCDALTTIRQELQYAQLNVTHIKTAVERTSNQPLDAPIIMS